MTDARIGYGTSLEVFSGGVWVEIAELFNITPGEATTDKVDATHMKSPGRRREYIAGLIDSGDASFEINWLPGSATDVLLRSLQTAGTVTNWRITFNNGVTVTFGGSVTGFSKVTPLDDKMTATLTLAVSGGEAWGTAAAPANTLLPSISGQPKVGQILTAIPGAWSGVPAFTYQWKRGATNIAGATGETYTPVTADIANGLTVAITGANSAGTATATSYATANVIA